MPRIQVEPGQLHSASGRQLALADEVASLCGTLEAAGASAAGAAGEAVAGAAIADCAAAWSLSLQMLARSVAGLGSNLGSASTAYETTDATVMPR